MKRPTGHSRLRIVGAGGHGKGREVLGLSVPAHLARALRGAGLLGTDFVAELTEDGILFRFNGRYEPPAVELPSWAASASELPDMGETET
jgi:hypothetical protein